MASLPATTDSTATYETEHFALRQRQARMFAMSLLVPQHLRNGTPEQAMANCYVALALAEAMGEMPLIVMQNIHFINGKAGFASTYMIARANASGKFADDLDWIEEGTGDALSLTCFANLAKSGKRVAMTVGMKMAKAEGWTKNAKYQSMPEVMLRYRSASFLINMYAPEVMLGYKTAEEYEDMGAITASDAEPITGAALLQQTQIEPPQPAAGNAHPAEAEPLPTAVEAAAPAKQGDGLFEKMTAIAKGGKAGHQPEGRADSEMGERPTLADAKAEVDACETVIDVNSRTAALLPLLGEEDADQLRNYAMDRVQALGGGK